MKLFSEDAVFVQFKDLKNLYILSEFLSVPVSIIERYFKDSTIFIKEDEYKFTRFETKEEIEFFSSIKWIVDYDNYKDYSEEKLTAIALEKAYKSYELELKIQFDPSKKSELYKKQKELEYEFLSLRDVFWVKQKQIHVKFPKYNKKNVVRIRK